MAIPGIGSDNPMTFQEMGEVQSAERGSTALTKLPDQFYERAASYLKKLIADIENSSSGKAGEPDTSYYRKTEEYRRAKDVMERIYSTRERKIVLAALNSSRGVPQSTENMVHDEEELYYSLKMELETIRDRILRYDRLHKKPEVLRGETGINTSTDDFVSHEELPSASIPVTGKDEPRNRREEQDMGTSQDGKMQERAGKETPGGGDTGASGRVVIRAIQDIEPFVDTAGRTISLKKEDIATLTPDIADVLVKGGMARMVEER